MDKKGYFQCQQCGLIHKEKIRFNIEDIYSQIRCPRCRGETQHLWVGEQPEDVYWLGNNNLDERYFLYNTK